MDVKKRKGSYTIGVRLPEDIRRDLEREAAARGMQPSTFIRAVMQEFLRPGTVKL